MLSLQNVSKSFQTDRIETIALSDINLHVNKGEFVSVMGPSGCGKSTLLNIIGALDKPDSGEVLVAGNNIVDLADKQLAAFRSREIGFVFQSHHLLPQCTVMENIPIFMLWVCYEAIGKKQLNKSR